MIDEKKIRDIASAVEGKKRVAGEVKFVKDNGPLRRDIRRKDFEWSPDVLRELATILWYIQRAHSFAMSAHRSFSKIPSSTMSPDGLLGGMGYIQSVPDLRKNMSEAINILSSIYDTLYDEISADHWSQSMEPETEHVVSEAETQMNSNEQEPTPLDEINPSPESLGQVNVVPASNETMDDMRRQSSTRRRAYIEQFPGSYIDSNPTWGDETSMNMYDQMNTDDSFSYGEFSQPDIKNQHLLYDAFEYSDDTNDVEMQEPYGKYDDFEYDNSGFDRKAYAMLPGANNMKLMDWYNLNNRRSTEQDVERMYAMSAPEIIGESQSDSDHFERNLRRDLWGKK